MQNAKLLARAMPMAATSTVLVPLLVRASDSGAPLRSGPLRPAPEPTQDSQAWGRLCVCALEGLLMAVDVSLLTSYRRYVLPASVCMVKGNRPEK